MSTAQTYIAGSLALALLDGCASMQHPPPPSIDQIVELAHAGTPAEEMIRQLQDSRAVYPLTATQIVKLHEDGVPDTVLDYMQNAYAESIRRDARMQYEGAYGWHNCFYCYRSPVIVVPR
jgi:hypothetical protein